MRATSGSHLSKVFVVFLFATSAYVGWIMTSPPEVLLVLFDSPTRSFGVGGLEFRNVTRSISPIITALKRLYNEPCDGFEKNQRSLIQ